MGNYYKFCPKCNTSQDANNEVCQQCGYVFSEVESLNEKKGSYKKRRPILAMLLQLPAPGLGYLYNGQIKKAIIAYAITLFLVMIYLFTFSYNLYGDMLCGIVSLAFILFIMIDALIGAKRLKRIKIRPYNKWYIYLVLIIINAPINNIINNRILKAKSYKAYKIPAGAMRPTLLVDDHLIANKHFYLSEKPSRGDLVIFKWPKDERMDFIKRVVGIAGDKIQIKDNVLYINDKEVKTKLVGKYSGNTIYPADEYEETIGKNKHYILHQIGADENYGPVTVPKNSIFVLGDNRDNSDDSRYWGFVKLNEVIGKPLYLYWAKDKSRIGMKLH